MAIGVIDGYADEINWSGLDLELKVAIADYLTGVGTDALPFVKKLFLIHVKTEVLTPQISAHAISGFADVMVSIAKNNFKMNNLDTQRFVNATREMLHERQTNVFPEFATLVYTALINVEMQTSEFLERSWTAQRAEIKSIIDAMAKMPEPT